MLNVEFILLTVILTVLFTDVWFSSGVVVIVKSCVPAVKPETGIMLPMVSTVFPSISAVIAVAPSVSTVTLTDVS